MINISPSERNVASTNLTKSSGVDDWFHAIMEWGIPTQQKSHTAQNENSVPYSRIFVYAAI